MFRIASGEEMLSIIRLLSAARPRARHLDVSRPGPLCRKRSAIDSLLRYSAAALPPSPEDLLRLDERLQI